MFSKGSVARFVVSIAVLALSAPAPACGPFFPPTIVDQPDASLLKSPRGDFEMMVMELVPKRPKPATVPAETIDEKAQKKADLDGELNDLRQALRQEKMPAAQVQELCAQYEKLRTALDVYAVKAAEARWQNSTQPALPEFPNVEIPKGLPAEFDEYLQGAILYHKQKFDDARKIWRALLDRPAGQNKYRAVWAAYMIGRSYVDTEPDKAVEMLQKARQLAGQGFADSQGLADASIGWEARAEMNRRNYERSVELYLKDEATWSLRTVCENALEQDAATLRKCAQSPTVRALITSYLVCNGGPCGQAPTKKAAQAWIAALESADLKDVRDADRLAWAAYQAGEFKAARRWLSRAKADSPVANWIEAKLLMRDGKIDQAAGKLAAAVPGLPRMPDSGECRDESEERIYSVNLASGELAVLKLLRKQYVDALDLLLKNDWWTDAAYVAERVLTTDELRKFVDTQKAPSQEQIEKYEEETSAADRHRYVKTAPPPPIDNLRHLLARRLVREGNLELARTYMPEGYQDTLKTYTHSLQAGENKKLAAADRAKSLWTAATTLRENGMELMGTELGPDLFSYGGSFEDNFSGLRLDAKQKEIAPPTADEKSRVEHTAPDVIKRFHYRYKAADLAWKAADLMPDNDNQTAIVLCQAGSWLKAQDPKAADRFYKALVRRCRKTDLGAAADTLRWFPPLPKTTQPASAPSAG